MLINSYRRFTRAGGALLIALACFVVASAQGGQTTGNVRGIIQDPNGSAVSGATVTLVDKRTNETQTTQTTGDGDFSFNNLKPGDYDADRRGAQLQEAHADGRAGRARPNDRRPREARGRRRHRDGHGDGGRR